MKLAGIMVQKLGKFDFSCGSPLWTYFGKYGDVVGILGPGDDWHWELTERELLNEGG